MTLAEALPSVNAGFNALSACALFAGYWAIRTRRFALHWKLMATAFAASTLFLIGYLTRFALTGVHRFPLDGPIRTAYYVLLTSHTILAVSVLPFVLRTLWLSAVKRKFAQHKRVAVWTFPVWAYVSVTGVIVYVMLYRLPGWMGHAGIQS
jgi:putative membrane protein